MRAPFGHRHAAILVALGLSLALGLSFAAMTPASAAARPASAAPVTQVTLRNRVAFTPTTIIVHPGDIVAITATGTIHFGGGRIKAMTPPGIPWGAECNSIALSEPRKNPWPAPGLSCWSLIARIGDRKPIEIGSAARFRVALEGKLALGLNDNFVDDNTGEWIATIRVTPAPPITGPGSAQPASKKSSNTAIFVLIGAAVLAAILLLILYLRVGARRRRRNAEWSSIEASAQPEPALAVGAAAGVAALAPEPAPIADPVVMAPPETDSIDVNIFEVEFSNGLTLRVGYNHFPEGTELRWRVTQSRIPVADGVFVARGGGSTSHVETVPLGVKLAGHDTHPDGADVQFDWSINGVPFRYSVRRDPNC